MGNIKTTKEMAEELISENGIIEGLSIAKRAITDCPETDKQYWQEVMETINNKD